MRRRLAEWGDTLRGVDLRPLTVVTGGSAGIGGALTRRLAARGERILITGRDPARLARMAEGTGAETLRVDLLDEDGLEILLRRLRGEPEIGLLVNNAGAPFRRPLLDHHAGEAERAVRLLYLAMIETTGAAWAGLVRGGGSIVNVVSVAGSVSTGSAPHYAAAKHAALAWSRALHVEAAGAGVHVLTANPGPVATTGFPHDRLRSHPVLRRLVIDDDDCAGRILRALERGRPEAFQPGWWRMATIAQAVAPGTMTRLARAGRTRFG
jgi:short-subunit dehydrogenase